MVGFSRLPSRMITVSPDLSEYDGTSTRLPLTRKWPWRTTSRAQARQLVRHGHFLVNGKRVDIPSFSLKSGDTVIIRDGSRENPTILHAREEVKGRGIPEWISPEGDHGAKVVSMPTREQINLPVQEQLIVELYSK